MGTPWARYRLEFKIDVLRMVLDGQSRSATVNTLGMGTQTLAPGSTPTMRAGSLAQANRYRQIPIEMTRLRADPARVTMKRDLLEISHGALCKGVGPGGYHDRKACDVDPDRPRHRISNDALLVKVRAVHAESKGKYGWPRGWKKGLAQGIQVTTFLRQINQAHRQRHILPPGLAS
ncbi:hypothetical protein PBR20603_04507 [Pandoraea bronchicola]|uniref:Transposase n=1 Tax=Pandoraea bronchicola TaxID=2508287 RepID=A0A5E5BZI6_9BURK|nr:hypothetical protein PBR20603_04507 [Pandoraea bronchicola]